MDLSALSLQKINREKRERQPNWTESEKELLLSLTRMHRSILENKGSDTMTIKQKSEAWDEIALRMNAAGFNRSKERLKQQLGRIRAAEAKRIKDAMEKSLIREQINSLHDSTSHSVESQKPQNNDNHIEHQSNYTSSISLPLQEHQYIKSEEILSLDDYVCSQQEKQANSRTYTKPSITNYAFMNACKVNKNVIECSKIPDNMHFKLQHVQSLADTDSNVDNQVIANGCTTETKRICAADVTSTIPCSTISPNIESNQMEDSGNDENANFSFPTDKCETQQRSKRVRNVRSNRMRNSFRREQSLRQLYIYRVAVERERLRNLKLQQKRERILYRKDIEIQNLKLQILRNLSNQNRDGNSINF